MGEANDAAIALHEAETRLLQRQREKGALQRRRRTEEADDDAVRAHGAIVRRAERFNPPFFRLQPLARNFFMGVTLAPACYRYRLRRVLNIAVLALLLIFVIVLVVNVAEHIEYSEELGRLRQATNITRASAEVQARTRYLQVSLHRRALPREPILLTAWCSCSYFSRTEVTQPLCKPKW